MNWILVLDFWAKIRTGGIRNLATINPKMGFFPEWVSCQKHPNDSHDSRTRNPHDKVGLNPSVESIMELFFRCQVLGGLTSPLGPSGMHACHRRSAAARGLPGTGHRCVQCVVQHCLTARKWLVQRSFQIPRLLNHIRHTTCRYSVGVLLGSGSSQ